MHGIHKLDIPLLSALKLFYQTHPRKKNKSLQKVKNIGFTDMFLHFCVLPKHTKLL